MAVLEDGIGRNAVLNLPPPFRGRAAAGSDPFVEASALAAAGCDPGLVVHDADPVRPAAALVLAPDVALRAAIGAMAPACGLGFHHAMGALAPPQTAVHLSWSGGLWVNGAVCGRLRAAAQECEPDCEPDWLVMGLEARMAGRDFASGGTSLAEEGCGGIAPTELLESWSRHVLSWINRWSVDGPVPLLATWRGLAHAMGESVEICVRDAQLTGVFIGVDDEFCLIQRDGGHVRHVPPDALLEPVS